MSKLPRKPVQNEVHNFSLQHLETQMQTYRHTPLILVLFTFCQKLESSGIDFICNKINLYCLKCTFDIILNHINANALHWINGSFSCSTKVCNLLFLQNQCKHYKKTFSSWLYLQCTNIQIINGNPDVCEAKQHHRYFIHAVPKTVSPFKEFWSGIV